MIEHTYQVLGYHRLLDILSQYASCPLGETDCRSLKPSNDPRHVENQLRLVSEMRTLLKVKGFVSLADLTDVMPALRKSNAPGSCLEANELLAIFNLLDACRRVRELVRSNEALCPRLHGILEHMPAHEHLARQLRSTLSVRGAVKDSASSDLKKIRERKSRLRLDLERKLKGIQKSAGLSDDGKATPVTVRDGRYVVPLRMDKRSRVEGIIHDYSQTGNTCFMEPLEVIPDNNRIAELAQEERMEVIRILSQLTDRVREAADDLAVCQSQMARLDGLYARARLGDALSCVMPEMVQEPGVSFKAARNPILAAMAAQGQMTDPPVPTDIMFEKWKRILIISGPNRGGKTVALKTLGLLSLMAQAGLHIPAEEGSCLSVFDQIMADIGDEQDIQAGLSTFSAHAGHLKSIMAQADSRSLVIIDEPGMGTDPDEGVALTMAVLDFLSEKETHVALSTHLNRLKAYGLINDRAVNAAFEFDRDRKRPTFKLKYGSPGISHALEIARDMGLPSPVLDRARGYLDRDEIALNRLIERLNLLMKEARNEKQQAEAAKRDYRSAEHVLRERLIGLEAEKKAFMESKQMEADEAIQEGREALKEIINLLRNGNGLSQARATDRYREISSRLLDRFQLEEPTVFAPKPETLEAGQSIYHKRLKKAGVIQSVDASNGRAQDLLGNVRISADIEDLEPGHEFGRDIPTIETAPESWQMNNAVPVELNLIGYRVDDAIPLIDKTMDRALVEGELTLRIVHGFGTGRLREAIRSHLKGVPFVKKVSSADPRYGGDAITLVELS